jgi:hypothetical protein
MTPPAAFPPDDREERNPDVATDPDAPTDTGDANDEPDLPDEPDPTDIQMANLLLPDLRPRDEGDTEVDDLVQPSARNAPRLSLDRRRKLLSIVGEELEVHFRNSGKVEQVIHRHRVADAESASDLAARASVAVADLVVPPTLSDDGGDGTDAAIETLQQGVEADTIEQLEQDGGVDLEPAEARTLSAVLAAIQNVPREAARGAYLRSLRSQQAPLVDAAAERLTLKSATPEERERVALFTAIYDQVKAAAGGEVS